MCLHGMSAASYATQETSAKQLPPLLIPTTTTASKKGPATVRHKADKSEREEGSIRSYNWIYGCIALLGTACSYAHCSGNVAVMGYVVAFITCIVYLLAVFCPDVFGINVDRLTRWEKSRLRLQQQSDNIPKMDMNEFNQSIQQGHQWTVLDGHVVDLDRLGSHPGGDYLNRFVGRDLTPWFLIQHVKNEKVIKTARHCIIGRLDKSVANALLCQADQEYLTMHEEAAKEGIFDVKHAWLIRDTLEVLVPMCLGNALYFGLELRALGIFSIAVGSGRILWVYHDIMHYAVFDSTEKARWWAKYISILIPGFNDELMVGDRHSIHHAFPNVIGLDGALEMGPVKVHPSQGKPVLPKGGQNAVYYGFIAWITFPFFAVKAFLKYYNSVWFLLSTGFRVGLLLVLWQYLSPMMIGCIVGSSIFPLVASFNHFHMDMGSADELFPLDTKSVSGGASFTMIQTQTIQNHDSNALTDTLSGHLTLHIEHHLFPHAPRRNYARLTKRVQTFLTKYNLEYNTCSQAEALGKFNGILLDPSSHVDSKKSASALLKIPSSTTHSY